MSGVARGQGKEAVRLCEHIVRQAFGNVVCRVASVLLNRGRLPLPILTRLSGLKLKQAAGSVIILMQHNLVRTTCMALIPSSSTTTAEDQYEFDISECLNRLRYGRILALTAAWPGFGDAETAGVAEEIVKMVMIYGKITVQDLESALTAWGDARRQNAVQEAMLLLVQWRFLIPTTPELQVLEAELSHRRFFVLRTHAQNTSASKVLTANQLSDLRQSARNEIENERDELQLLDKVLIKRERLGKKKKKGDDEVEYELRPTVHLRINHDRYGILIRDELIVKAAEDRYNDGAGIVMRAVCAAALHEDAGLMDPATHKDIFASDIQARIPNTAYPTLGHGLVGGSGKKLGEIVQKYLGILAGEDQQLANGAAFLIKRDGNVPSYRIEVEGISIKLREALLADLVRQRVGEKAGRVLAVVTKARIASEQTVRDCAMLSLKDARILLARLQKLSLVETTEVPKTGAKLRINMPTGGSEYHLWSVDLPRVYNNLLSSIYKTMANTLERRAAELNKKSVVLEKESRAAKTAQAMSLAASLGEGGEETMGAPGAGGLDARGLLQRKDQDDLAALDGYVRKLILGQQRSDLVAFILKDLPGWPAK